MLHAAAGASAHEAAVEDMHLDVRRSALDCAVAAARQEAMLRDEHRIDIEIDRLRDELDAINAAISAKHRGRR